MADDVRKEKKVCRYCKKEIMTREDPHASAESLAYGSNNAGLKFPRHKKQDGSICEGSGVVLQ